MSDIERAAAQETQAFVNIFNEVFVYPLLILLTALALVVFIYGAAQYVLYGDNEQERATGQKHMLFGIIGLFIMLTAFAIMQIFAATFGLEDELNIGEGVERQRALETRQPLFNFDGGQDG